MEYQNIKADLVLESLFVSPAPKASSMSMTLDVTVLSRFLQRILTASGAVRRSAEPQRMLQG